MNIAHSKFARRPFNALATPGVRRLALQSSTRRTTRDMPRMVHPHPGPLSHDRYLVTMHIEQILSTLNLRNFNHFANFESVHAAWAELRNCSHALKAHPQQKSFDVSMSLLEANVQQAAQCAEDKRTESSAGFLFGMARLARCSEFLAYILDPGIDPAPLGDFLLEARHDFKAAKSFCPPVKRLQTQMTELFTLLQFILERTVRHNNREPGIIPTRYCSPSEVRKVAAQDEIRYDVSSKGAPPFHLFSPFYPHGRIPVPNMRGFTSASVEGIWQGLKIINGKTDFSYFEGKGKKRPGKPTGHQWGNEVLPLVVARRKIYLPAYRWMLEHKIPKGLISMFCGRAREGFSQSFYDFETNPNIDDPSSPLSHASLLVEHLNHLLPL